MSIAEERIRDRAAANVAAAHRWADMAGWANATRALVEAALWSYAASVEIVRDYPQKVEDIQQRYRASPGDDAPVQTDVGEPTKERALALDEAYRSMHLASWRVERIDSVLVGIEGLHPKASEFVRIRYLAIDEESGRHVWELGWCYEDLAQELGIGERELYRLRRDVLERFAVGFGLM